MDDVSNCLSGAEPIAVSLSGIATCETARKSRSLGVAGTGGPCGECARETNNEVGGNREFQRGEPDRGGVRRTVWLPCADDAGKIETGLLDGVLVMKPRRVEETTRRSPARIGEVGVRIGTHGVPMCRTLMGEEEFGV